MTPAGERLYAAVRQSLSAIDRCVDEIRGVGAPPRVTVATYASFASLWLVPRLAAFQKAHPEIEIRIDVADRLVDLEAEEIDMAVRWLRPGSSVDPNALLLGEEEVAPALSPRLLESSGLVLNAPADLMSLPLLEMDDGLPSSPHSSWARWAEFAKAGAVRPHAGRFSLTSTRPCRRPSAARGLRSCTRLSSTI